MPTHQGAVYKKGSGRFATWAVRHFAFDEGTRILSYAKRPTSTDRTDIPLAGAKLQIVDSKKGASNAPFTFDVITEERTYELACNSEASRAQWLTFLSRVCGKAKRFDVDGKEIEPPPPAPEPKPFIFGIGGGDDADDDWLLYEDSDDDDAKTPTGSDDEGAGDEGGESAPKTAADFDLSGAQGNPLAAAMAQKSQAPAPAPASSQDERKEYSFQGGNPLAAAQAKREPTTRKSPLAMRKRAAAAAKDSEAGSEAGSEASGQSSLAAKRASARSRLAAAKRVGGGGGAAAGRVASSPLLGGGAASAGRVTSSPLLRRPGASSTSGKRGPSGAAAGGGGVLGVGGPPPTPPPPPVPEEEEEEGKGPEARAPASHGGRSARGPPPSRELEDLEWEARHAGREADLAQREEAMRRRLAEVVAREERVKLQQRQLWQLEQRLRMQESAAAAAAAATPGLVRSSRGPGGAGHGINGGAVRALAVVGDSLFADAESGRATSVLAGGAFASAGTAAQASAVARAEEEMWSLLARATKEEQKSEAAVRTGGDDAASPQASGAGDRSGQEGEVDALRSDLRDREERLRLLRESTVEEIYKQVTEEREAVQRTAREMEERERALRTQVEREHAELEREKERLERERNAAQDASARREAELQRLAAELEQREMEAQSAEHNPKLRFLEEQVAFLRAELEAKEREAAQFRAQVLRLQRGVASPGAASAASPQRVQRVGVDLSGHTPPSASSSGMHGAGYGAARSPGGSSVGSAGRGPRTSVPGLRSGGRPAARLAVETRRRGVGAR